MTKKQLLKKLENVPDDILIILSSDSEGNNFSKLESVYTDKNTLRYAYQDGRIELYGKEEVKEGDIESEEFNKLKRCVVLFP